MEAVAATEREGINARVGGQEAGAQGTYLKAHRGHGRGDFIKAQD